MVKDILEKILEFLAWLTKYGFIDILFGVGIFGYIAKTIRNKKFKEIDGIEIFSKFELSLKIYKVEILNNSKETLYIYRSHITPGFWGKYTKTKTNIIDRILNFIVMKWEKKFPQIDESEKVNNKGQLVPVLLNTMGDPAKPPFLEDGMSAYFNIKLSTGNVELTTLPSPGETALLTLHVIHGVTPKILEVQL